MQFLTKSCALCILILSTTFVSADDSPKSYHYELSVDKNMSAYSGADISMSMIEAYRQIEDKLVPSRNISLWGNIGLFVSRYLITNTITTYQHEVFGHGARLREFGWPIIQYQVDLGGGGSTSYFKPRYAHPQKNIVVDLGGIQATEVLSNTIKSRMIESSTINPVYGAAYLSSRLDQPLYILHTKYTGNGHDISNYIKGMNQIYGPGFLTKSKVKSRAILDLFDPFLYYGAYSMLTNTDLQYPMIQFGDIGYLPATRAILTPYGLESKLINYIRFGDISTQLNFSHGKNKSHTSSSAEVIVDKIAVSEKVFVGAGFMMWSQPKLFDDNPRTAPNKIGGSFVFNTSLLFHDTIGAIVEGGYKTAGFQLGRPIEATPLIRFGMKLNL